MIDVIVVSFNRPKETRKTIESLLKANDDIRIILIDNDSSNKHDIESDDRITVINLKENIGQARAANMGLEMATSEYACIMHNDIVIHDKNWISKAVNFLKENPQAGLIDIYGWKLIDGEVKRITSLKGFEDTVKPKEEFTEISRTDETANIFKNDGVRADERYGLTCCGIWINMLARGKKLYIIKLKDGKHFQSHSVYPTKEIEDREYYLRRNIRIKKLKEAGLNEYIIFGPTKKKLYIFGAGGGAIQTLQDNVWYLKDKQVNFKPEEIIFVEDEPKADTVTVIRNIYPVIALEKFKLNPMCYGFVTAFNIPYKEKMGSHKLNWLNSFSKNYTRFPDIKMGHGVRINWATCIDGDVIIGNFVKINSLAFVGHGSSIGDYTYISQSVVLDNHVTVGSRCYIFENSTILPEITIGDNTVIGAGSVVTKDIPAGVVAYGNPCKVVRPND